MIQVYKLNNGDFPNVINIFHVEYLNFDLVFISDKIHFYIHQFLDVVFYFQ